MCSAYTCSFGAVGISISSKCKLISKAVIVERMLLRRALGWGAIAPDGRLKWSIRKLKRLISQFAKHNSHYAKFGAIPRKYYDYIPRKPAKFSISKTGTLSA
jgi:hypothetical protein